MCLQWVKKYNHGEAWEILGDTYHCTHTGMYQHLCNLSGLIYLSYFTGCTSLVLTRVLIVLFICGSCICWFVWCTCIFELAGWNCMCVCPCYVFADYLRQELCICWLLEARTPYVFANYLRQGLGMYLLTIWGRNSLMYLLSIWGRNSVCICRVLEAGTPYVLADYLRQGDCICWLFDSGSPYMYVCMFWRLGEVDTLYVFADLVRQAICMFQYILLTLWSRHSACMSIFADFVK